ncbi:hypothetical protein [Nocardia sp. NPDC058633]|uniref:hypothetical protein n=1 Tax=Nocardia sp. NPDC058633 TaxID=3346568 RepID=UPI003650C9C2
MTAAEYQTFALDAVVELTGAPSVDWLDRRIKSGELTAVLSGREWRMTHSDMCRLVDNMRAAAEQKLAERLATEPAKTKKTTTPAAANRAGLSARGAARAQRRQTA